MLWGDVFSPQLFILSTNVVGTFLPLHAPGVHLNFLKHFSNLLSNVVSFIFVLRPLISPVDSTINEFKMLTRSVSEFLGILIFRNSVYSSCHPPVTLAGMSTKL